MDGVFFPENEKSPSFSEPSIEQFLNQMETTSQSLQRSREIDQLIVSYFQSIQETAITMMQYFEQQKAEMLNSKFNNWLLPLAQEVLDPLSEDAKQLKAELDQKLLSPLSMTEDSWIEHAKAWVQLYAKWHDRQALVNQVLKLATDRTNRLIDKDIQMIQDYQMQSLSQCSEPEFASQNLEQRMQKATETPLKALTNLKIQLEEVSAGHLSDWINQVHQEREKHLEQLLNKIDGIVKESGYFEDIQDPIHLVEIEGDLAFMEAEWRYLNNCLRKINPQDQGAAVFILDRLNELEEHISQFDHLHLPPILHQQMETLRQHIEQDKQKLQ